MKCPLPSSVSGPGRVRSCKIWSIVSALRAPQSWRLTCSSPKPTARRSSRSCEACRRSRRAGLRTSSSESRPTMRSSQPHSSAHQACSPRRCRVREAGSRSYPRQGSRSRATTRGHSSRHFRAAREILRCSRKLPPGSVRSTGFRIEIRCYGAFRFFIELTTPWCPRCSPKRCASRKARPPTSSRRRTRAVRPHSGNDRASTTFAWATWKFQRTATARSG